jgi:heptose I phosphotransferase
MVTRSFLMTAEVEGGVEGDHHLRAVAPAPRRELLRRIAELTRRFHARGFIHKDYYLCHVLVAPGEPEPGLFLIDLQRVVQPCCLRRRWLVKDLAALAYSALKSGASRADLRAAFRIYRDRVKLTQDDRILARAVLQRVAWLRTRTPKHDTSFQQLA